MENAAIHNGLAIAWFAGWIALNAAMLISRRRALAEASGPEERTRARASSRLNFQVINFVFAALSLPVLVWYL